MKKIKVSYLVLAFVMGLTFLLAGCNQTGPATKSAIVKTTQYENGYKYDPPITLTTIRFYGPQVKFQQGDTISSNVWTKAYYDYLGIDLQSVLVVTDYKDFDMKITTSMTSDTLPDLIPVYTTLFFRMADNNKLADLKESYDKYLDPNLKILMEKEYGGIAYKTAFRKGILAALSAPPGRGGSMLWIRQDWLDKYNLPWPKNLTETLSIAKTFAAKNPGAPDSPQGFAFPLTAVMGDIAPLANAMGAYYGIWQDDGKGGISYSSLDPKWKPVLKLLADMVMNYQLDPTFNTINGSTLETCMFNQQFGVVFGSSTSPDGNLYKTIERNPKAVWKQDVIMKEDGTPSLCQNGTRVGGFTCMNKRSQYPEAVMFLANVYNDLTQGVGIEFRKYHDFYSESDKVNIDTFWYPVIGMSYPPVKNGRVIADAVKRGDTSKLSGEQLGILDKFKQWETKQDPYGWRLWAIQKAGGSAETIDLIVDNNWIYLDRGWGPEVQAWVESGPTLTDKNNTFFLSILRGDLSVEDGFNQWVSYFNKTGGGEATTQMNDWWSTIGKKDFKAISTKYVLPATPSPDQSPTP